MERKISSSLTEFNKVLSAVTFAAFVAVYSYILLNYFSLPLAFFSVLLGAMYAFVVVEAWKNYDVKLVDSGLIVTKRSLFAEKNVFVPFEKIESVKNKFLWFENTNQVVVKFTEKTELGDNICFSSKDYAFFSESVIVGKLNSRIAASKEAMFFPAD